MIHGKVTATLPAILLALSGAVMAADPDILKNSGALERLLKKSGVYNASSTGKTPGFVVDPSGRSRCRITGCWARSADCMSTSTTMSGSTTGRAR